MTATRGRMSGLLRVAGVALLAIVVASRCSGRSSEAGPREWPLSEMVENDVSVSMRALVDQTHQTWVAATYTPTRAGFHLYSKDLPRDGLSGIGRPTLLELAPGGAIVARGDAVADQTPMPLYVPVLKLSFPVYPEGPVTLRLPVTVKSTTDWRATFSVTYLACSDSTCLAPVTRKPIVVTVPAGFRPATT